MTGIGLLLTVALVHLVAVMSPGPDFVVCLRNTLKYSRSTGLWTALGFACGILVHVTYCALGVAILISQSVLLFSVVKLLGAAYLIYLGAKAILSKPSSKVDIKVKKSNQGLSAFAAWKDGFLTNVLNPKATLYFLGFFSVVMPPDVSLSYLSLVTVVLFVITFAWFAFVTTVMTLKPIRQKFLRIENTLDKVFGGILILLGLKVATAKL